MIRCPDGDFFLLTTQADHAHFAGQLVAALGNNWFAPADPLDRVVLATSMHDAGWPLHDDHPLLNADGVPLHVFEAPVDRVVQIWSESVEHAAAHGPDCGLLVSLHQFALSDLARQHISTLVDAHRQQFDLNKFQQSQIERQERFRQALGLRIDTPRNLGLVAPGTSLEEDRLRRNFRILTLCDRLSLQLCCGKMLFSEIDDVMPNIGAEPEQLITRYIGDNELTVDPWPFRERLLRFEVPTKRIAKTPFDTVEAFRSVYTNTRPQHAAYQLRSP